MGRSQSNLTTRIAAHPPEKQEGEHSICPTSGLEAARETSAPMAPGEDGRDCLSDTAFPVRFELRDSARTTAVLPVQSGES